MPSHKNSDLLHTINTLSQINLLLNMTARLTVDSKLIQTLSADNYYCWIEFKYLDINVNTVYSNDFNLLVNVHNEFHFDMFISYEWYES